MHDVRIHLSNPEVNVLIDWLIDWLRENEREREREREVVFNDIVQ